MSGIMNNLKHGADLTHPKLSGGWIVGAVVAVAILVGVAAVGMWLYRNSIGKFGGAVKTASADVAGSMPAGIFGNGT